MYKLHNGTVVITGASSDTGVAIAMMFAHCGCERIFVGDASGPRLEECRKLVVSQYPSVNFHSRAFDRSREEDVDNFFATVTKTFGRIDFSVNVVFQAQETIDVAGRSIEKYDRSYSVYQKGVRTNCSRFCLPVILMVCSQQAFLIQRALLRQMLKQEVRAETECRGSIVNIVEFGPTILLAHNPITAAVANAVIGLSKTDAFDYMQDNIRINCIAASEVLTPRAEHKYGEGVFSLRKGRPDDVASTATWISSPMSSWLTGMIIPVDGGLHLHSFW
ncbi:hypothetical protein LTR84_011318 [Exophiala bonariae]|uniref:Uncharacterized protein n=1 Tax=Exophiala bonariae TaxID=1690606 RepID=A0AAV9MUW3_9EURO|nr:hypothetical protein LTR84_011318 [Exophiala bonariae]